MKKKLLVILMASLMLASCAAAPLVSDSSSQSEISTDQAGSLQGQGRGQGLNNSAQEASASSLSDQGLTDPEIEGLLFMREEEKLARDVYLALADVWGMNIFSNIAGSESIHMDAVLSVIESSGLEDPVKGADKGEFENQDLQALYDDLIDRGNQSLEEALLVGGAIEEIDIMDLENYLEGTENSGLIAVYQNLLKGSINHLKAYVRSYERQSGEIYSPQFLSQDVYDSLMASTGENGGGAGRGMGQSTRGNGMGK